MEGRETNAQSSHVYLSFKVQIHGESRTDSWMNFLHPNGENRAGYSGLVWFLLPWAGSGKSLANSFFSSLCLAQAQKFGVKF